MGYGPAPGPTKKKALCHTCLLGGACNKYRCSCINTVLLQLLGRNSAGHACSGMDLAEYVSATGDFLRPQGAIPQAFTPLGGGGYCLAPEAPLIRGMLKGP